MTEEQLRDVLARAVPEPPDSVADPVPVVRAARRQRRIRVAAVSGLAAVLVAGAVVGVLSPTGDQRERDLVADQPTISDPLTTAECPPVSQQWISMPVDDLGAVTAVRYCTRASTNGFPGAEGPSDALVVNLDVFAAAVGELTPADPARCAAVDPIPTDSRLLLQFADGTYAGIPAGTCQDAELGGRTLDGADVTSTFLSALGEQRDDHAYGRTDRDISADCAGLDSVSPARPGHESLVAAIVCSGSEGSEGQALTEESLAELNEAWRGGRPAEECAGPSEASGWVLALTDHGDLLRMSAHPCGYLEFYGSSSGRPYGIPIDIAELSGR